jgi:hypothetical protein
MNNVVGSGSFFVAGYRAGENDRVRENLSGSKRG